MSLPVTKGSTLSTDHEDSADWIVIGTGAGGMVAATHLAEAGDSVLLLEEGPYYTQEEIRSFRPSETMRKMWREGGLLAAVGLGKTPIISVAVGRNVGGSSVHTGGVCFRIPSYVHREWVKGHGLETLSEKAFDEAYRDVEERVHVEIVPREAWSRSTQRFADGAAKLGVEMKPLRRNTHACEGNARCNFGCPAGAKLSVDLSYLPSAAKHGARVLADAWVSRVVFRGDRAVGVEGHLLRTPPHHGKLGPKLKVHANKGVIVACGTLHTPLVLQRSGIKHAALGRNITLHPAFRVGALFDERVHAWDGAMQGAYVDHYEDEGITMVGMFPPVNVLAGGLPGVGPAHRRTVRRIGHIGTHGGMVHDAGGGVVHAPPFGGGREPILTYEMAAQDLVRLRHAVTLLGEMAFEAGAREVYVPVFGVAPLTSRKALLDLERDPIDPARIECMAFHPLGSARMANDPRRGIVDERGRVYGTKGLYVVDGSVLPTSIGVNSQVPIMTMATRLAWQMVG